MTRITDEWLQADSTQRVLNILTRVGYQALVVGGCVRNALLNVPVADIDISTSATPDIVTKLGEQAGYRVVPTGIDHGTVTVIIGDTAYEVTTFRRDIDTDGRRAKVVFSTDIEDDARRRDFTMNALYADADGEIFDPLNGLPDLEARRVRFIEDAEKRIREDYLRSLRYFRFYAWYGDHTKGTDAEALGAIASNLDGLENLAAERVGSEMLRLLGAPDPSPALAAMLSTGVLATILPGADPQFIAPLVHLETIARRAPDPVRRLAALGGDSPESHLRLSNTDMRRLSTLQSAGPSLVEVAWRHGAETAWDTALLQQAMAGEPLRPDTSAQIEKGIHAVFPIEARDLMPDLAGQALGDRLKELELAWIASDFSMTKEQLENL